MRQSCNAALCTAGSSASDQPKLKGTRASAFLPSGAGRLELMPCRFELTTTSARPLPMVMRAAAQVPPGRRKDPATGVATKLLETAGGNQPAGVEFYGAIRCCVAGGTDRAAEEFSRRLCRADAGFAEGECAVHLVEGLAALGLGCTVRCYRNDKMFPARAYARVHQRHGKLEIERTIALLANMLDE